MTSLKHALTALLLALAAPTFGSPTLIENVHGYTLTGDRLQPFSGLVFDLGKVVATGNAAGLRKRFPDAQVIDGHDKTLLPGLIDAHGHVLGLGLTNTQVALFDTESLAQAQDRIRAYAKANPDRAWLLGGGWNQVSWKLGRFPLQSELDAGCADRPVVLWRIDHHAEWLNTKALTAAGITKDTKDPAGGALG